MGELKYLSGGQNKNKNLFWNKILFWNGPKYIDFFIFACYREDNVEGGIKIKKKLLFLFQITTFGCRRVR
jgi:hypothetical protein